TGSRSPASLIGGERGQTVATEWNTKNTKEGPGGGNLTGGLGALGELRLGNRACKLKVGSRWDTSGSEGDAPICQPVGFDVQGTWAPGKRLSDVTGDGEEIYIPYNINADYNGTAGRAIGSVLGGVR